MANTVSNHMKYQLGLAAVNFNTDAFKIILMATGFTFNKDTHATYADVSASELATNYGYTQNTKPLGTATLVEDDTNDRLSVTWANAVWTASGGSIGPSPGALIYDDTTSDNTVVGYIDFGGDQTATNGGTFTVPNIEFRLS
jgi:hypothetical protein